MQPIGKCSGFPAGDLYRETNTNTTFPYTNHTGGSGVDVNGDGQTIVGATAGAQGSSGTINSAGFITTIPVLSSIMLGAIATLSIVL